MIIKNNKGQTLIEAVVALAFASIIIAAIALTTITSLDNATFSKNQNLATNYAQEGITIVRQKSQSDWDTFNNLCTSGVCNYCLDKDSISLGSNVASCTAVNITDADNTVNFIRRVTFNSGAACTEGKKVSVSVFWSSGKCKDAANPYCHEVTLDSCLAKIN